MKKSLIILLICMILTGCESSKKILFKVQTGDNIEITLNTNDNYDISYKSPIEFSKDNNLIAYGIFITIDTYNEYIDSINSDIIIEKTSNNNIEYIFYKNDNEYNYIIKIKNSNTGLIITSSKEEVTELFKRINITKK